MRHYFQVEVQQPKPNTDTEAINPQSNYSKCFDDDGRLKRTGTYAVLSVSICTIILLKYCMLGEMSENRAVAMVNRRNVLDRDVAYHNGCDRIGSAVPGMGDRSARLGCRACCLAAVRLCQPLHFESPVSVLPVRGPGLGPEELHIHGCCEG